MSGPEPAALPLPAFFADTASDLNATAAEFVPHEPLEPASGALHAGVPVAGTANQERSHRSSHEPAREIGHHREDQSLQAWRQAHWSSDATRGPTRHREHRGRGRSRSRSGSRERRGKHHRDYGSHRGRDRSRSRSGSRERRERHRRRRSRSRSESRERRGKHERERGVNHRPSQRGGAVDAVDDEQQLASLLPSDLYAAINDDRGASSTGPMPDEGAPCFRSLGSDDGGSARTAAAAAAGPLSVEAVFGRPFPRQEELDWIFEQQRRRRLFDEAMCVTYGMEPIESIAADYRNTRYVLGNEGPAQEVLRVRVRVGLGLGFGLGFEP